MRRKLHAPPGLRAKMRLDVPLPDLEPPERVRVRVDALEVSLRPALAGEVARQRERGDDDEEDDGRLGGRRGGSLGRGGLVREGERFGCRRGRVCRRREARHGRRGRGHQRERQGRRRLRRGRWDGHQGERRGGRKLRRGRWDGDQRERQGGRRIGLGGGRGRRLGFFCGGGLRGRSGVGVGLHRAVVLGDGTRAGKGRVPPDWKPAWTPRNAVAAASSAVMAPSKWKRGASRRSGEADLSGGSTAREGEARRFGPLAGPAGGAPCEGQLLALSVY